MISNASPISSTSALRNLQRAYRWGDSGVTAPDRAFALPTGTVTFLLTDVEGSTRLWSTHAPDVAGAAMARQFSIIADQVARHGGVRPQEQGEGDSVVAAFARPSDALRAAVAAQRSLRAEAWPTVGPVRVRMAVHTGEAQLRDDVNYAGQSIIRTARLRALGHGGQILVSGASRDLAVDQFGDEIPLVSLGEHGLRDLGRPEQVWQVVDPDAPEEFPPLSSAPGAAHNLPLSLTPFIGRIAEIEDLAELVAAERMVTVTGTGGAGKTRLAQQVGAALLDDPDLLVRWVELAPLGSSDVLGAVRSVFGLADGGTLELGESVRRALGGQRGLLILDNCEHVVDTVRGVIDALTRTCPTLRILATSRVTIDVPGEVAWRVPPLALPDRDGGRSVEAIGQFDAVRLFCDRARRARPNFRLDESNGAVVAELCHRLDGIPLAIELAAARCRMMSPAEVLDGLDDALRLLSGGARTLMPRQQTLEASIAWSVELLTPAERVLLARLSVFAGGWSLDAAEAIGACEELTALEVLDVLDRLVGHSLVSIEDGAVGTRFTMLETVRQFATRTFVDERRTAVAAHAAHFAARVAEFGRAAGYRELVELAASLAPDHANIVSAFDALVARGDVDAAAAMIPPCREMFARHASYRRMCDVMLARPEVANTELELVIRRERAISFVNAGEAAEAFAELGLTTRLLETVVVSERTRRRVVTYHLHFQSFAGLPVWNDLEPHARELLDDPDPSMRMWGAAVALSAATSVGRAETAEWHGIASSIGFERCTLVTRHLCALAESSMWWWEGDERCAAGVELVRDSSAPMAMRLGAALLVASDAIGRSRPIPFDLELFRRAAHVDGNALVALAVAAIDCGEALRRDDLAAAATSLPELHTTIPIRHLVPHWRWMVIAGLPVELPPAPGTGTDVRGTAYRLVEAELAMANGQSAAARGALVTLVRQAVAGGFPPADRRSDRCPRPSRCRGRARRTGGSRRRGRRGLGALAGFRRPRHPGATPGGGPPGGDRGDRCRRVEPSSGRGRRPVAAGGGRVRAALPCQPGRGANRVGGVDADGGASGRARRRWPDQPRDRSSAVDVARDGEDPPVPDVPEAGYHAANAARGGDRPSRRRPRLNGRSVSSGG